VIPRGGATGVRCGLTPGSRASVPAPGGGGRWEWLAVVDKVDVWASAYRPWRLLLPDVSAPGCWPGPPPTGRRRRIACRRFGETGPRRGDFAVMCDRAHERQGVSRNCGSPLGGALTREKVASAASRRLVIRVGRDELALCSKLGRTSSRGRCPSRPGSVAGDSSEDHAPALRENGAVPIVTDNANLIVDREVVHRDCETVWMAPSRRFQVRSGPSCLSA
jgi:hypothetical protein